MQPEGYPSTVRCTDSPLVWKRAGARGENRRKWPFLWPVTTTEEALRTGSVVLQAVHAFGMVRGELRTESLSWQHPLPALKGIKK